MLGQLNIVHTEWQLPISVVHSIMEKSAQRPVEDEIQTKVLNVFFLVIHSHLYSFAKDFFFYKLTQPLTVSVKGKGGKPDSKSYPFPMF
jgi:hypothetical protein